MTRHLGDILFIGGFGGLIVLMWLFAWWVGAVGVCLLLMWVGLTLIRRQDRSKQ